MQVREALRKEWPVIFLLIAPFIASLFMWDSIPDQVPTNFDFEGNVNDYGPKWILLILFPGMAVISYLGMLFLPLIDPKKRIKTSQKPIVAIRLFTSLFFIGLYVIILLMTIGKDINIQTYVTVGVGLLIFILGNYLNSVKPNYFIGIRTPWTLENATVWKKTHRMGSKLWMAGGAIMMVAPLIFGKTIFGMQTIAVIVFPIALIPVLYSYFAFRNLEKSNENDND